ncbi:MAG: phage tail protein [Shinella sp.]|uniref:phage tail protein n=1 Tax=Shinella sp. TaxID=1870904 RepID=UPI0040374960
MSTPYLGEIRMFGFARVPVGWHSCDGGLLSIAEYDALYNLLGTTYGGDGQTTFGVPDLRGRLPMHWGTGQGLSPHVAGELSGTESVTLITNQIPQHTHTFFATTTTADIKTIETTAELGALGGDTLYATDVTGLTIFNMSSSSTKVAGNTQPHDNLMPTLTVQFCIAVYGIYPTQS